MRRKACSLLLLSALILAVPIISGYGDGAEEEQVEPNQFKKQETEINLEDINRESNGEYKETPEEIKKLSFTEPDRNDEIVKKLFATPKMRDRVDIRAEVQRLGIFD